MFDTRHGTSLKSESIYAQFSKTCVQTTTPVSKMLKMLASVESLMAEIQAHHPSGV